MQAVGERDGSRSERRPGRQGRPGRSAGSRRRRDESNCSDQHRHPRSHRQRVRLRDREVGSARAVARRHDDPPARTGAARGARSRRGAAPARGDPRPGRFRISRGLGRRVLRRGRQARRREPLGADPRAQGACQDATRPGAPRPFPRRLAASRRRLLPPLRRLRGRERDRRLPAPRPAQRRLEPARSRRGDRRRRARLRGGPRLQPGAAPARSRR